MNDTPHPNLAILQTIDIHHLDTCADQFADDFVWHYFNPKLPDVEGDYRGVVGLKDFFSKLNQSCDGTFHVQPVEARDIGDELVVVQVRNGLTLKPTEGGVIEFDAVVIWRMVNGKIAEAWDIPAVYTIQTEYENPSDGLPLKPAKNAG